MHMVSAGPSESASAQKIFNQALQYGMKHHIVGFPLYPNNTPSGKIIQIYQYTTAIPRGLAILFKLRPDVIHVHYPVASYLAKIYCLLTRKKFVTTYHISGIPKHLLHKKADYAIAISNELQDELSDRLQYKKEQVKLIHNGISTGRFHKSYSPDKILDIKKQLKLPTNKIVIGFIGSFTYRKGIDILLDAIRNQNKNDYHLILVGEGDENRVSSHINRLDLEQNVTLYPYQDPVIFYEIIDIFILPSRKEGFPLVTVEAMMMGIPTIRSRVEGATDQIEHGETGYLFTNENSKELSNYIQLLLTSESLRESIGNKSKEKAIALFSEDTMIAKLLEVYNQVSKS